METFDVRLRRELTHRRLFVSLSRRLARVASLHLLDAALVLGVVALISRTLASTPPVGAYGPLIATIFLLSLNALSAYRPGDARRDEQRLLIGSGLATLILVCLVIFPPHVPLTPAILGAVGAGGFVALTVGRKLVDLLVRQVYVHGIGLRRALLIGNLGEVSRAIHELRDDRNIDQYLVGHLAPDDDPTALGRLEDLPEVLSTMDVQEVILTTTLPPDESGRIADACFERGVILYVFPGMLGPDRCRVEPRRVGGCALLHLYPARFELPAFLVKRVFDLVLAVLALGATAPLMALIAVAIRLDSRGPVFFRQVRVGLGGQHFTIWKFRSMAAGAEAQRQALAHLNAYGDKRLFKVADDPRITRVGRLLRRTSLDELPQLFNVLLGDMSLVGPRPPLPCEVADYEPHHFDRLAVVPGITGPWQVGGRNLIKDFETVVQMERSYIHGWSLLLDIKILLRTVRVVITGEGAY